MQHRTVISLSLIVVFAASCVSLPTAIAPWAEKPQSLREVFPDSAYIAQRGRGKTRAAAEAAASAEIARYITSQVSAQSGYKMTSTETDGKASETLQTLNEAQVKTEIDLFGIRYADGAFYDKERKEWHAAAYIERAEAWQAYEPRIKTETDAFQNLYAAADNEDDAFKKVLRFDAAAKYTERDAYQNTLRFAQILSPARLAADFAEPLAEAASLPQKIDSAKRNATVFIDCPADFEGRVSAAFAAGFNAEGFAVAGARQAAAAVCVVTVTEGEQKRDLGVFYNPSLRAELQGKSGVLASFNITGAQAQAVTPDVAKRRAYTALAESVGKNFSAQFASINKVVQ